MATLTRFRKATLTIDGQPVEVQVSRLKLEEAEAFRGSLRALMDEASGVKTLTSDEAAFVRSSIEQYLSLAPSALDVDGQPVTTGAQLLELIGEKPTLVLRALLAIAGKVTVSEDEGKPFASESALVPSSDEPGPAPHGVTPKTTADAAAPSGAPANEDATAATDAPSSGPRETSS